MGEGRIVDALQDLAGIVIFLALLAGIAFLLCLYIRAVISAARNGR